MLTDDALARAFKSLSHPRRARLFRLLAEHPETGQSFTALHRATGIGETPLVHHLREMERCGLLVRRRKGAIVTHVLTTGPLLAALTEAARLGWEAIGPARPRAI